jgi:hypothetical protein
MAEYEKLAAYLALFLWGGGESWPEGRHSGMWGLAGIAAGFRLVPAAARSETASAGQEGLSGGDDLVLAMHMHSSAFTACSTWDSAKRTPCYLQDEQHVKPLEAYRVRAEDRVKPA